MIDRLGVNRGQRQLGIRITVNRPPTREEVVDFVRRTGLSILTMQPAS